MEFHSGVRRERFTSPLYLLVGELNSDSRTGMSDPVSQGKSDVSCISGSARTGSPLEDEEGRREGKDRRVV